MKIFWVKIFLCENFLGENSFWVNFFSNIILKYSIVRVSFVDLRWAQLYVSLVSFQFVHHATEKKRTAKKDKTIFAKNLHRVSLEIGFWPLAGWHTVASWTLSRPWIGNVRRTWTWPCSEYVTVKELVKRKELRTTAKNLLLNKTYVNERQVF